MSRTQRQSASSSSRSGHAYDPYRDALFTQAPRSSRSDHSHLSHVINNPAVIPSHPQNQASRSHNAPHPSWTDHSSSHLRISPYQVSDRDFHPSPIRRAPSSGERPEQRDREQYQPPIGGYYPNQAADRRTDPYDAVGYIRRDGEVYDQEEMYEEYRPYDPHAHQRGQRGYYTSNGTSH